MVHRKRNSEGNGTGVNVMREVFYPLPISSRSCATLLSLFNFKNPHRKGSVHYQYNGSKEFQTQDPLIKRHSNPCLIRKPVEINQWDNQSCITHISMRATVTTPIARSWGALSWWWFPASSSVAVADARLRQMTVRRSLPSCEGTSASREILTLRRLLTERKTKKADLTLESCSFDNALQWLYGASVE